MLAINVTSRIEGYSEIISNLLSVYDDYLLMFKFNTRMCLYVKG